MTATELDLKPQFITDAGGQRVGVILDMDVYRRVLEALEDLRDQADFDQAIAEMGDVIPFDQAVAEIERRRAAE